MARQLSAKPCEVTLHDRISGTDITLFYRLPDTDERVKYTNAIVARRGNKIVSNMGGARMRYGSEILLGFKEGAFENDEGKLISSDAKSENYDKDWKALVRKFAPDIIEALATHVFEASVINLEGGRIEPDEEDEENPKDKPGKETGSEDGSDKKKPENPT